MQVAIRKYICEHSDKYSLAMLTANAAEAFYMADEISPQIIIIKEGMNFYNAKSLIQDMRKKKPLIQYVLIRYHRTQLENSPPDENISAYFDEQELCESVIEQMLDKAARDYDQKLSEESESEKPFSVELSYSELIWLNNSNLFAQILNETVEPSRLFAEFPTLSDQSVCILIGESVRDDEKSYSYYQNIGLMSKLYQQLNILLKKSHNGTVFITSERKICFLLNRPSQLNDVDVSDYMVTFAKRVNRILTQLKYPASKFSYGNANQALQRLHSSYRAIDALLKYHFFVPDLLIITQDYLKNHSKKLSANSFERNLEFINIAFRENDLALLTDILNKIELSTTQALSFHSFYFVWSQMTIVYTLLAQKHGLLVPDSFRQLHAESFQTINTAFYALTRCFRQLFNDLPYLKVKSENTHIRNAISYILAHINEDTSLSVVAKGIHISPSYLSHLFQKEFSKTYVDYNNQLRINYALNLIHPTTKIYQVAAEVGFENNKYFSKVFKKVMGITPMEYKNNLDAGI